MNVELRRFTTERHRRRRDFQQHLASAHYRIMRANLLLSVLTRARAGTLTGNWRESLALRPLQRPASPIFDAGDQLAVREVATRPPAAWEPHSGAGWRVSLDAWFDATTDTYRDLERVWRDTDVAHRAQIAAQRESIRRLRGQLRWPQPAATPVPDKDCPYSPPRLHVEAWYRAGLAGGGEGGDWIRWLQDQDSDAGRTLLARLAAPGSRGQLEHLPGYWNPPPRPTS